MNPNGRTVFPVTRVLRNGRFSRIGWRAPQAPGTLRARAQILLLADGNRDGGSLPDTDSAKMLECPTTVERVRKAQKTCKTRLLDREVQPR